MTQATNFGVPTTGPASPDVMASRIQNNFEAALTGHSGNSRPSYAEAGTIWQDTSVSNRVTLYFYDGTNDIAIGVIDTLNNRFSGVAQPWVDVATASTIDVAAVNSENIRLTGTTTVNSFGSGGNGTQRFCRAAAAFTLAASANIITPGGANISVAAGDTFTIISLGSGNWVVFNYQRAAQAPIAYEEGTFTPRIDGTSSAGSGTYTTQFGRYTRIGRKVFFEISLSWTAHTGTGNLICSGLPFTSHNASLGVLTAVSIFSSNLSFSGQLCALVPLNSTQVQIRTVSGGAGIGDVAMDTSASVFIAGEYTI